MVHAAILFYFSQPLYLIWQPTPRGLTHHGMKGPGKQQEGSHAERETS